MTDYKCFCCTNSALPNDSSRPPSFMTRRSISVTRRPAGSSLLKILRITTIDKCLSHQAVNFVPHKLGSKRQVLGCTNSSSLSSSIVGLRTLMGRAATSRRNRLSQCLQSIQVKRVHDVEVKDSLSKCLGLIERETPFSL